MRHPGTMIPDYSSGLVIVRGVLFIIYVNREHTLAVVNKYFSL